MCETVGEVVDNDLGGDLGVLGETDGDGLGAGDIAGAIGGDKEVEAGLSRLVDRCSGG